MNTPKTIVSVIVTTKNNEATIAECLESIRGQVFDNFELIVVDNSSCDATLNISKKYTKRVYSFGPERSSQRNYGAKVAKGIYLLFIDSDMKLTNRVLSECVSLLTHNKRICAVIIPEESIGRGFWSKCKQLERSFYLNIGWMEAARFIQKDVFLKIGGFDTMLSAGEDFDLSQKITQAYSNKVIGRIKSYILHDEQNLSLMKTIKKKFYYGRFISKYQNKKHNSQQFKKQASILQRYRLFFSDKEKLFSNPIVGIGMIFMKTSEFLFGGFGYMIGYLETITSSRS